MTLGDLRAALERAEGKPDAALALTFVGRSSRGLSVRPMVLEHRADGARVYGVTVAQLRRWVARLEAAGG